MASITVTSRIFPTGPTVITRNVPGSFTFSKVSIDIDYAQWTSPATTGIGLKIETSSDNRQTWDLVIETGQSWPLEFRGQPITHGTCDIAFTRGAGENRRPITNVRLTLTVFGAPVTLGATVTAL